MKEQHEPNELAMLTKQLVTLREQIDKANAKMMPYFERRGKLGENFNKKRREINELKIKRDNLNEKVKTFKQHRDVARAKIRAYVEEVKANNQKIANLQKETPRESRQKLQKAIEDIEWKIQTTSFDLKEEKRLVENVRQLEKQLITYKKIDCHVKKISETKKEIETLSTNADIAHQKLTETAKESQEIHSKMITKIGELRDLKAEANILHANYLQAKEEVKPLQEEFRKLTKQKKKLQDAIREVVTKIKKNAEQAIKDKIESQAKKKLQRGEKISWNEFKMLTESESENA